MTTQPVPPGDAKFKLSRSTVFPFVGGRSTWSQEHLLPIVATIAVGLAMLVLLPDSKATGADEITQAWQVYAVLGVYIAFMVNYYVNQMCGRPKRLWLLAVVAFVTLLLLGTPVWHAWFDFFYAVIPAAQWQKSSSVAVQLAGWFFGTGLCEEGFKSLPLFAFALLGGGLALLSRHTKGRLSRLIAGINKRVGLREPLDGIVMGVASGSGFFIYETLGQYVPSIMTSVKYPGSEAFDGLVLLLSRGLPELVEHSAWCGLFGYFIGLSALRPKMAIFLVPLGWFSAAALHAGWDGLGSVTDNPYVILGGWLFLGLLSYALLAGAIFKALEISPRRAADLMKAAAPPAIASATPALATAPSSPTAESDWD